MCIRDSNKDAKRIILSHSRIFEDAAKAEERAEKKAATKKSVSYTHLDVYKRQHVSSAASIMEKVILFAPLYERIIESYKAELYIKGWVNIRKKNHILRYIPSMFRPKKGDVYKRQVRT